MTPLCQTDSLVPSTTQQQNLIAYCQEDSIPTAILPTFASDIDGQHSKIGGITFKGGNMEFYLLLLIGCITL